ncbi:MAG: DUF4386 family protein [Actinomycetota bacterium]|nr:DUF4386 family protein [Actinomycetota bacterium]
MSTTSPIRHDTAASPAHPPAPESGRLGSLTRIGGIAALVEAATFVVGIALFATVLSDYATGDPTPAESVSFVVDNQGALYAWYLITLIVFGIALVPLALALHRRIRDAGGLAQTATAFGVIWSGLILATGMIDNIGLGVVSDLADTDPTQAEAVWSSLDAITNGLGGGNELAGGIWVLLVSVAALQTRALPRSLNVLGIVSAAAGLVTVVPGLEDVGLIFGLGLIVWFTWLGAVLVRSER